MTTPPPSTDSREARVLHECEITLIAKLRATAIYLDEVTPGAGTHVKEAADYLLELLTSTLPGAKKQMREWASIAAAMGYEPKAHKPDTPFLPWLTDRIAKYRREAAQEWLAAAEQQRTPPSDHQPGKVREALARMLAAYRELVAGAGNAFGQDDHYRFAKRVYDATPIAPVAEGAKLDDDGYLWKWIERGLFDQAVSAKEALGVIAHHPAAPWKSGRWDVDHKPYAAAFYKAFPKAPGIGQMGDAPE